MVSIRQVRPGKSKFKEFIKRKLYFKSTQIDPDVYIRSNRMGNRTGYCKLLLVYVDDILAVSHFTESIMKDVVL